MKISLLHATRGRPERTLEVRSEWLSKATNLDLIEHIYACDGDDPDSVSATAPFQGVVVEKPKGCFRAYNLAAEASTGDILIPIEDDLHPQLGWDENVRDAMKDHFDKVAILAVGDGQNLCIEWCITRKFYEERGLFHDDYFGLFGDTEWRTRARQDRVPMVLAPGIIFWHQQFQPGSGIEDPVFLRKQAKYLADELTYNQRGRAGWPK